MPLAIPPVHSAAILRERALHVQPRSIVDFALYAGANGENLDEIEPMADAGAIAFKTFRTRPPKGREPEFVGITCPDAGQMLLEMEQTARTGLLHVVHAEDQQILDIAEARARATGRHDGRVHALSRPEVVETASVAQCIALAEATGARLQIAHMSAVAALDLVARAKADGLRVTAETCPHYLVFTEDALAQWGPYAKCNPPLRTLEAQQRLWEAVSSEVIDVIGTDHSPYTRDEKEQYLDNIWDARAGVPALEEFVPIMLTAVSGGHLTLPLMARLMSENPARLFGLWPRKGSLAVGADADLAIVDTQTVWVHDHRALYTKSRDTGVMYDGMRLRGRPLATIVRGQVVMRDGRVVDQPGGGVRPGR